MINFLVRSLPLFLLLSTNDIYAQKSQMRDKDGIKSTVVNFLSWYGKSIKDTTHNFKIFNGGPEFDTTKVYSMNYEGVKAYMQYFRETGFVSEDYLCGLEKSYTDVGAWIERRQYKEGNLIPGMETDMVMGIFEPELIFDNLPAGKFDNLKIIDRSALVRFKAGGISMLFFLTRFKGKWMIDKLAYDTRKPSAASQ